MNDRDRPNRFDLEDKGAAVGRGVLEATNGDMGEAIRRLAAALAYLTSPSKECREMAKRRVKQWAEDGRDVSLEAHLKIVSQTKLID